VPEDRQRDGLVLAFPIADNLILNTYYQPPFTKGVVLDEKFIYNHADELVKEFDIRTPSSATSAGSLSGGNQQKVIVAREFSRPIKLLIASQPTRGLDVGSVEYIHERIIQKRDEGCAVLLVSSELDEIMGLSDRIAVMYRGKIVDILPAEKATKEQVGLLMAGVHPEAV
jgi:simple sugar transport system ATP-binding protein